MFSKDIYVTRRRRLLELLRGEKGIALFLGNAPSPAQYKDNCYKFRQDSTWLYYWGIDEPYFAATLDLETGEETIFADDVSIDDIIWMGPQPSVAEQAASVGVAGSAPYAKLNLVVSAAIVKGRPVHTIPPSRHYGSMKLQGLGIDKPSEALIRAIIAMRLVKQPEEIVELDAAGVLGQKMHTVARRGIRLGRVEQEIVGEMEGVTLAEGWGISFETILTQHGEVFHNHGHAAVIEPGKLMVVDAGAEGNSHYASDFTRTYPTSGKYSGILALRAQGIEEPKPASPRLYIAALGEKASDAAAVITERLRQTGAFVECDLVGRSLKAQMKYANKIGADYTLILGDNELESGRAFLRDMKNSTQTEVELDTFTLP